jgi:glycosyltransferase involved in cell wall biosynthesis
MNAPSKVIITGGHELGGVASVASALAEGFNQLGIPSEIVPPRTVFSRIRDLRDPSVLKILSTTAVYASPLAKRAIAIAHGLPCADVSGWPTFSGVISSYKVANRSSAPLVAVSEYTAVHLQYLFAIRIAACIRNPLKPIYLEPLQPSRAERSYITYIGRLHPAKNIHHLLPAVCELLKDRPDLRACIIGKGEMLPQLQKIAEGNPGVEFVGAPDDAAVREYLRETRVFMSGNSVEGLGVTYLEALSQGCCVAMPASGGGVELALDRIGESVFLLPLSYDRTRVVEVLRNATRGRPAPISLTAYQPLEVARAYLKVDSEREQLSGGIADRSMEGIALT